MNDKTKLVVEKLNSKPARLAVLICAIVSFCVVLLCAVGMGVMGQKTIRTGKEYVYTAPMVNKDTKTKKYQRVKSTLVVFGKNSDGSLDYELRVADEVEQDSENDVLVQIGNKLYDPYEAGEIKNSYTIVFTSKAVVSGELIEIQMVFERASIKALNISAEVFFGIAVAVWIVSVALLVWQVVLNKKQKAKLLEFAVASQEEEDASVPTSRMEADELIQPIAEQDKVDEETAKD